MLSTSSCAVMILALTAVGAFGFASPETLVKRPDALLSVSSNRKHRRQVHKHRHHRRGELPTVNFGALEGVSGNVVGELGQTLQQMQHLELSLQTANATELEQRRRLKSLEEDLGLANSTAYAWRARALGLESQLVAAKTASAKQGAQIKTLNDALATLNRTVMEQRHRVRALKRETIAANHTAKLMESKFKGLEALNSTVQGLQANLRNSALATQQQEAHVKSLEAALSSAKSSAASSAAQSRTLGKRASRLGNALSALNATAEEQRAKIVQLEKQLRDIQASGKAAITQNAQLQHQVLEANQTAMDQRAKEARLEHELKTSAKAERAERRRIEQLEHLLLTVNQTAQKDRDRADKAEHELQSVTKLETQLRETVRRLKTGLPVVGAIKDVAPSSLAHSATEHFAAQGSVALPPPLSATEDLSENKPLSAAVPLETVTVPEPPRAGVAPSTIAQSTGFGPLPPAPVVEVPSKASLPPMPPMPEQFNLASNLAPLVNEEKLVSEEKQKNDALMKQLDSKAAPATVPEQTTPAPLPGDLFRQYLTAAEGKPSVAPPSTPPAVKENPLVPEIQAATVPAPQPVPASPVAPALQQPMDTAMSDAAAAVSAAAAATNAAAAALSSPVGAAPPSIGGTTQVSGSAASGVVVPTQEPAKQIDPAEFMKKVQSLQEALGKSGTDEAKTFKVSTPTHDQATGKVSEQLATVAPATKPVLPAVLPQATQSSAKEIETSTQQQPKVASSGDFEGLLKKLASATAPSEPSSTPSSVVPPVTPAGPATVPFALAVSVPPAVPAVTSKHAVPAEPVAASAPAVPAAMTPFPMKEQPSPSEANGKSGDFLGMLKGFMSSLSGGGSSSPPAPTGNASPTPGSESHLPSTIATSYSAPALHPPTAAIAHTTSHVTKVIAKATKSLTTRKKDTSLRKPALSRKPVVAPAAKVYSRDVDDEDEDDTDDAQEDEDDDDDKDDLVGPPSAE